MTGRRAHWSDDLIESVRQTMRDNPWSVFAVIAAVEDWQVQHARDKVVMVAGNPGTYVGGLEAAIQRVQAVCDRRDAEVADMDPFFRQVVLVSVDEVRDALGGESDE